MANRETIVHRLVSVKNQIHRRVDIVFPELRQVYKHLIGSGSLATLRLFPTPADLQKLTVRQIIDGWKTVMKRHSSERRADELLSLARHSVGAKQYRIALSKRVQTRTVRVTGLHPPDRCNEGMKGHRPVEKWE